MTKRRPALDPSQLDLGFGVPEPASSDGALSSLERVTASAVGLMLRTDGRSRFEIAGAVSRLMEADVSKMMLDAYASEARDGHNISHARFLALTAATRRYDCLDATVRQIGGKLLVGEEVYNAEYGSLKAQKLVIEARMRQLEPHIEPLTRGIAK